MLRWILFLIAAWPVLAQQTPGPAAVSPSADNVLRALDAQMQGLKSWQANFTKVVSEGRISVTQSGTVRFLRPAAAPNQPPKELGRADFSMRLQERDLSQRIVAGADGVVWQIVSQNNLQGIYKLDLNQPIAGSKQDPHGLNPIDEVSPYGILRRLRDQLLFAVDETQELGARRVYVLTGKPKMSISPAQSPASLVRLWIGVEDSFLYRLMVTDAQASPTLAIDLSAVRMNLALEDDLFKFVPPAGANIQDLNSRLGAALR